MPETTDLNQWRERLGLPTPLIERLADSFSTPEAALAWLQAPNGCLGGLRPLDALWLGEIDAGDAALEALDAGVFV